MTIESIYITREDGVMSRYGSPNRDLWKYGMPKRVVKIEWAENGNKHEVINSEGLAFFIIDKIDKIAIIKLSEGDKKNELALFNCNGSIDWIANRTIMIDGSSIFCEYLWFDGFCEDNLAILLVVVNKFSYVKFRILIDIRNGEQMKILDFR
ncbi:MAG: hypothetical protein WBL74_10275 [Novosphingobium sp.]|uniref:hypothetical protein n=1 Tax=Novosphingobium sp. TaxID=1874826 RepID=UPI003C7ACD3F